MSDTKQTHKLSDLSIDDGARDVDSGRRWLPIILIIAVIAIAVASFIFMRGSKSVTVTTATARAAETGARPRCSTPRVMSNPAGGPPWPPRSPAG